ncbi:uncharacterized protein PAC_10219 [Phialocephala subalpina]|uniref:Heterokaryon incompatibility domain-containing protein n=1 Tax=Phialocephala subalpina TaxID=576137 RepID=A0A1L7X5M2_9HELO|nr:uncharacterized protein PAC_10219 [Phialocephala subalpina]
MAPRTPSTVTQICSICAKVPWLDLNFEDLEGYPHHSSLNALVVSAQTCLLCKFVLHAAVSNYRRSLKSSVGKYRRRRFETVHTHESPSDRTLRKAAYVKEFGQCMPTQESDTGPNPCGFITPMDMGEWNTENVYGRPVVTAITRMTDNSNEQPVEDAPLDLAELKKQIPSGHSIWLYGNYWTSEGHGSGGKSELGLVLVHDSGVQTICFTLSTTPKEISSSVVVPCQ